MRYHQRGSAVERDDAGRPRECPVCGDAIGTGADVYVHLMVDHRKSTLSSALIENEGVAARSPPGDGDPADCRPPLPP